MKKTIFFNSYDLFVNPAHYDACNKLPGGHAMRGYYQLFSNNISTHDRTNTFTTPIKTDIMDHLKLPEFKKFDRDFGELIDERAIELMNQVKESGRKLAVMYSGGIDSTAILCGLLKNCSEKDLKDHVVVLLSDHSILENPNFYKNYVVKKFECVSSFRFPYFVGNDDFLLISGECADQCFGSQVTGKFSSYRPYEFLFEPLNKAEDEIVSWMIGRLQDEYKPYAPKYMEMFKHLCAAAPIPIDTLYKFLWWINFTNKWQSVYVRVLPYSKTIGNIKILENYTTFYCPEQFQLWAMNNSDRLVKNTEESVKYIIKDYILAFNGDQSYYSKPKVGSLTNLVKQKEIVMFLNDDMSFTKEFPTPDSEYINQSNTFADMMK
jgi:hypothetical protein